MLLYALRFTIVLSRSSASGVNAANACTHVHEQHSTVGLVSSKAHAQPCISICSQTCTDRFCSSCSRQNEQR